MYKIFIFISFSILFFACKNNTHIEIDRDGDTPLAKVGDKTLYLSDIAEETFFNIDKKDSLNILKNYVSQWIEDEVYLLKAKENLTNIKPIQIEVENYEKELINGFYDKQILNTAEIKLTEEDLKAYYEKHKEYFIFDEQFYELRYILLPRKTSNLALIKKEIEKGNKNNWMIQYCEKHSMNCFIEKGTVKNVKYLTEELNLPKNNLYVSTNFRYQYVDEKNILIYKIDEIYKEGKQVPFEMAKHNITKLALYNKQQEYLLDIKEKTIQKAKNDKIFENYIN